MDRRQFLSSTTSSVAGGLLAPHLAWSTDSETLPAGAIGSGIRDALPGKLPLIKRSFRPPNYETPIAYFRHALTPNDAFYVRWHAAPPSVTLEGWRLRITGPAVQRPSEFTHDELRRRFEIVEVPAVNQCSGNRRGLFSPHVPGVQWGYGAMGNATWRGVRLRDVLESAGVAASAIEVVANGADVAMLSGPDFIKSLPMWKALDPDTLIAFEMNEAPLPSWNGFPARLVVPGWTATYWVKALVDLQVSDRPFDGFWMKTAYRVPKDLFGESGFPTQDTAQNSPITTIKINSLIVDPAPGQRLTRARPVRLQGIAWDGGSGVQRVETSLDGGTRWREATLGADLGRFAWRQWYDEFTPQTVGVQSFMVRAIARDGSAQSPSLIHNPAGYHHNVIQKVDFDVA
jgi:DMSO/TMAO reductase YedYZ molybdopterin-dependent catalytic subunit